MCRMQLSSSSVDESVAAESMESGSMARQSTPLLCPANVCNFVPVLVSQMMIVVSALPENRMSVCLKAPCWTS